MSRRNAFVLVANLAALAAGVAFWASRPKPCCCVLGGPPFYQDCVPEDCPRHGEDAI